MRIAPLLFGFAGRVGRRQFWVLAVTVNPVFGLGLGALLLVAGLSGQRTGVPALTAEGALIAIQFGVNLALMAKRLHDRDRSAWFLLAVVVPVIGAIWLVLELYLYRGTAGPNRFGPAPRHTESVSPDKPANPTRFAGPSGRISG